MSTEPQQYEHQLQQIIKFTNIFTIQQQTNQSTVLTSKNKTYLLRDMLVTNQDENQLPSILDTLSLHENLNTKYLLTLLYHEVFKGYDGNQYIKAIYEYGNISLKEEIENRKEMGSQFEEEELWAILMMIVKALSHLQQNGIVYGVLGNDKIFINQYVKILDPSATATDPLNISQGRLYSPQIINDQQQINMFKSDVYVLGLMLLQCGLLLDLSKQTKTDLSKHLQIFSEIYSKQLLQLIQSMLNNNPMQRPSFDDIKNYLVKQIDMNTTESNQPIQPCLLDYENMGSSVCKLQEDQEEEVNDVLYESICMRNTGNNGNIVNNTQMNKNNGSNNNKDNSNYYESQCDESECMNTEYQSAFQKYLAIPEVKPDYLIYQQQQLHHQRKTTSPLSTQKSSRAASNKKIHHQQHNNNENMNININNMPPIFTKSNPNISMNVNNTSTNLFAKSKKYQQPNINSTSLSTLKNGCRNSHNQQQFTDFLLKQSVKQKQLQSIQIQPHQSTSKKQQRTKQIKKRLVKNMDDSDLIRQEEMEEEENSNILSNYSDYQNRSYQNKNINNMNMNMKQKRQYRFVRNNKNNIENNYPSLHPHTQSQLHTHTHNRNHSSNIVYYSNFIDNNTSTRTSQQTSKNNLYNNSNHNNSNSINNHQISQTSQQNCLFTDPMLLKTIQDDIIRISTSKNSSYTSRDSERQRYYKCVV